MSIILNHLVRPMVKIYNLQIKNKNRHVCTMMHIICSIKFWFCLVGTNSVGDDILDYVLSGAARG